MEKLKNLPEYMQTDMFLFRELCLKKCLARICIAGLIHIFHFKDFIWFLDSSFLNYKY